MSTDTISLKSLAINTIRTLSIDGVQAANSGHPGTPMALAPVAFQLWTDQLVYDPAEPMWPNRDRFVLSCGHASMLLYSLLHVAGVRGFDHHGNPTGGLAIELDQIKKFRQLGSVCAGHPEYGEAAGIETTTGPLGQGCGNSVGMALAAKHLAARFNRPNFQLFNYMVYALCSDGDLMEGVAAEAASLAGHLGLGNLVWIYDDNKITIEGETDLAFSENVGQRFEAMGWQSLEVDDANDLDALQSALQAAKACTDRPSLIVVRSIIGFGSPNKANTHGVHGAPLGPEEVALTKAAYGWPEDALFLVPDEVPEYFQSTLGARGAKSRSAWDRLWADYQQQHPELASQLQPILERRLPDGWDSGLKEFPADAKGLATRVSGGKVLNMLAPHLPALVGGSADLAPSTMTLLDGQGDFSRADYAARNLHFGIREHGMASVLNGMALSGLRAYGATFFVFTDYMRASMRLSSLMHQPVLYVLTHDSIGLGEDGPTHQPVEHLAACRAIPGLYVFRPGDANEVLHCYRAVMQLERSPSAMVLSRQNVPTLDRTRLAPASLAERGAYVISPAEGQPQALLLGTGSELALCLEAQRMLAEQGVAASVVSCPCLELFEQQPESYRLEVLPPEITCRVACEAGLRMGWDRWLGERGRFVGMSGFGASAPAGKLYQHFGITAEAIAEQALHALKGG